MTGAGHSDDRLGAARLSGQFAVLPEPAARRMDARNAPRVRWSEVWNATVLREFRKLKKSWVSDPRPDAEWDSAAPVTLKPVFGGVAREVPRGNCNDFCPELRRRLVAAGLPAGALRLVRCKIEDRKTGRAQHHMVLAIEALDAVGAAVTGICCNIRGCWPLASAEWDNDHVVYRWVAWETAGRAWEALEDFPRPAREVPLDRLLEG